ncbi:MAG: hypothetical protein KDB53_04290 [Planctomycetes bacterium]|nr:hypothetical protein [Planctomycetota bacterium]
MFEMTFMKRWTPLVIFAGLLTLGLGCGKSTVKGEGGKSLTLVKPANQTITQGSTNKVLLTVVRGDFEGKVGIEIDDLPDGIALANDKESIAAGDNTLTVTMVADTDAALVKNHRVKVTASGPNDMAVSEFFEVTVQSKN